MTELLHVLDVRKVRLVQRLEVVTQRPSDEFDRRFSVIRINECIYAHIRFGRGLYAVEVVKRDTGKVTHGHHFIVIVKQFRQLRFQTTSVVSSMKGQIAEETKVVGVPFAMDGFFIQADDGDVPLHIGGKSHTYATDQMLEDAIDEEQGIRHEFAQPRRIQSRPFLLPSR